MYIAQDRPMQFFYRIFRKNKVLLRKRKIPNLSSQGKVDSVNSPLSNHATAATSTTTATKASSSSSSCNTGIASGGESSKALAGNSAKKTRMDVSDTNITIRCDNTRVHVNAQISGGLDKEGIKIQILSLLNFVFKC